jgi:diguanylate cyclase (GGDEF)-like protein
MRDRAWIAVLVAATLVIAAGMAQRVLTEAGRWRDRAALEEALAIEAVERIEALRALGWAIALDDDPSRRSARLAEANALNAHLATQASTALALALRLLGQTQPAEQRGAPSEAWRRFEHALAGAARSQAAASVGRVSAGSRNAEGALRQLVAWTLAGCVLVCLLASLCSWRLAAVRIARFERLAMTDELSGLPNRRASRRVGRLEFERNRRYRRGLSLILFDIDEFKRINDAYGHATGDRAIAAFGRMLGASLRGADFASREGGEEFLLIVPEVDLGSAVYLAERLRRETTNIDLRAEDGARIVLRVSAGVASALVADASFEGLLRRADQALYRAKRAGRNRVCGDGTSFTETLGCPDGDRP